MQTNLPPRGDTKPARFFSDAERVAFDLAIAAASQPNDVTDALFERAKQHWTEGQIVEIVALVSYFGFLNRFNDTTTTLVEAKPIAVAEKHIARHGWVLGKHGRRII